LLLKTQNDELAFNTLIRAHEIFVKEYSLENRFVKEADDAANELLATKRLKSFSSKLKFGVFAATLFTAGIIAIKTLTRSSPEKKPGSLSSP
jgi:hypothetical protein